MSDIITSINNIAFQFAGSTASPAMTWFMNYFAISFYAVLLAIGIFLYLKKDKNLFAYVVAMAVLFAISELLKMIFREPRPCQVQDFSYLQGICESGFGFPSSHATVLTGLYLFVKGYRYLNALYIIWLVIILFGRIYLGSHYLTDVVAGIIISLIVTVVIYKYRQQINAYFGRLAARFLKPLFGADWSK